MTEKQKKEWEDAMAPLIEYEEEQQKKREYCLEIVKENVSKSKFKDIMMYVEDCDFTNSFEITSEAPDNSCKQTEDYGLLTECWIDQYCNGGYTGDEFAGWVHIQINKTEFLKFHYSM